MLDVDLQISIRDEVKPVILEHPDSWSRRVCLALEVGCGTVSVNDAVACGIATDKKSEFETCSPRCGDANKFA